MENPLSRRIGIILLAERERWILWLPVAVGIGVAIYFAWPEEPARWSAPLALAFCGLTILAGRQWPGVIAIAIAAGCIAIGFGAAVERSHRVAAPVLSRPTGMIRLEGRIAEVEPQEHGERLILDQLDLPPLRNNGEPLRRIRVRLPVASDDLIAGQRIALRASLSPPPRPSAPGAYDFSRQAWFKEIGAVGYTLPPVEIIASRMDEGWSERARLGLAHTRHALTERIVAANSAFPAGIGVTAAALITAERGPVPPAVLQAFRDAGLAHILVIAGLHMSMVTGLVFMLVRTLLAAIPPIALRYPIKKWTAVIALLAAAGYLAISGAPVPTERAFVMNAIVLVAILLDREAISLRSISWAALVILLWQPEALIGPSFQMSFAAVYALISGYEALGPYLAAWHRRHPTWMMRPVFYSVGILLTTQIAGTATAFYTLYHFNRYATYALLGNALAVPLVGFWVMPAALLGFLLLPFGMDAWGWELMGRGIMVVTHIATWVSSLPGAAIDLPAMPVSALLIFTAGGFWLLLWKRSWRLFGLVGIVAGILLYATAQPPDLLIDGEGKVLALRNSTGDLTVSTRRSGKRARDTWMVRDGRGTVDGTDLTLWDDLDDPQLRCDSLGCLWRAHEHVVALSRYPESLPEDCRSADLVVIATFSVRLRCPSASAFIDHSRLRALGTHAIWLKPGEPARIETVAEEQGNRPWRR